MSRAASHVGPRGGKMNILDENFVFELNKFQNIEPNESKF
jgi:hypothetical protein